MRGSTGVDLFGIIDPQLNWNTVPKGKQRVPRKPRTSFIDNKKSTKKKSQLSEDIDKGSATGEMTVSDSEKLGVTLLGQRFDAPIEGVPIKKRFQMVKSSSVLSLPVSDAASPGCESERALSGLLDLHDSAGVAREPQNDGTNNPAEVADFSGISILAAAASSLSGDAFNPDTSESTKKEPDNPDGLNDKSYEQRLCSSFEATGIIDKRSSDEEADAAIVDTDGLKENCNTLSNNPEENTSVGNVKSNTRDVRLHWDLNKVMDAWECPLENDESLQETALFDSKVDVTDEKLVNKNSCSSSAGPQDIGCMSEPTSEMVSSSVHEQAGSCRKEDRNVPEDATSPEQLTNRFNKVAIGYSCAGNAEQPSPLSHAESPSCNLGSAVETEGSSSDEVSNREMKSVTFPVSLASGNENKGSIDCTLAYSSGGDGNEQVPNDEKQSADLSEVSSLCASVGTNHGLPAIREAQGMEIREGTVDENTSQACQSRENVESQHLSVSTGCVSGVSVNPVESDFRNTCANNIKEHSVSEMTDLIPANCGKASLHSNGRHEDFQSGFGSISVSASSLESMQRVVDQTVDNRNDAENHVVPEEPVDMEKIELEDGELRESMFDWEIDGNEDGEMEHVDYDTDSKDMYTFDDSSDHMLSAALPHKDNPEAKATRTSSKNIPLKETVKYASSPSLQSLSNIISEGKSIVGTAIKGASGRTDGQVSLGGRVDLSVNINGEKELLGNCNSSKRSSNLMTFSKTSGWDQVCDSPDADMEARRGRSNGPNSVSPSATQRMMVKSSVVKGVTLRSDRIHPSKVPHKKVGADIYDSRIHNRKDFNQTNEGNACRTPSSFSRNGPSIQMRERNKCGSWAESQTQSGSFQHEAPGYHSSSAFAKHGFKNAAEAAVARVAENGLVVAPDGTVVEPDHLESTVRASRTSSTSVSGRRPLSGRFSAAQRDPPVASGRHSDLRHLRDISPSRHIPVGKARGERYGHRGARYDGSNTRDDFDGPSLSAGHSFYQRDRSYSPHRGSFRIYACQSKSRSRSRTRSPPGWASPRKRGDCRRSGSPVRRWSRSPPNFRSDARPDDLRSSPGRRPSFVDRAGGDFIPPTKWISDRKDGRDNFRQHEYRRPSGRSPPSRPASHIHGRPETEEFRPPLHHGRFREFGGVAKRGRFDRDENRGRDGRFDRFASPPRQNDAGERVKRLHYDDDGFGLDSSCFQSDAEVSSGGRSRGFNRGIDNDIQRSPRRAGSDRRHFRYDTDAGGAVKHGNFRGDETGNVQPPPGKRA